MSALNQTLSLSLSLSWSTRVGGFFFCLQMCLTVVHYYKLNSFHSVVNLIKYTDFRANLYIFKLCGFMVTLILFLKFKLWLSTELSNQLSKRCSLHSIFICAMKEVYLEMINVANADQYSVDIDISI